MKPVFKLAGGLGEKLTSVFLGCLLAASWAANAQQATFISPAIVGNPAPNVNATNFINAGSWNIDTSPLPYQTFSTYNYTNTGTMIGSVGWDFSHGPYPNGVRGWAANFFNNNVGVIQANDGSPGSYLLISATNIVNQGTLAAGAGGLMILNGSGVNLSRSGLEITPIVGEGSRPVGNGTNFVPDIAIYDQFWFGGTNTHTFPGAQIWNLKTDTVGVANFNGVGFPCGGLGSVQIGPLNASAADSNTNNFGPFLLITTNMDLQTFVTNTVYSNIVRQAVFVTVSDPNITASIHFGPSLGVSNIFLPMSVQLVAATTNILTGSLQQIPIYVVDDLAAVYTNGLLFQSEVINPNAQCQTPTFRPDSVIVARIDPGQFGAGSSGNNGVPTNTFFYDPATFSNKVSVGRADAYSALVDDLAAEPPLGTSITNAPGKIEVYANDLNLSRVRVSAGAEIIIKATNLISSAGAAMDCQNLSYNLGSTNGLLNVTNLAFQTVQRFQGTVSEWSGLWTNYMVNIYTNNYVTNSMATNAPFYIQMPITNVTEMDLAITVVDASGLGTTVPVTVQDLVLHSTNMVVSDFMDVANTLLFDGQSLTIGGTIALSGQLQYWNSAIAPTLLYFTNNGELDIPNSANFGSDGPTNYAVFVNTGTINAGNETINSDIFQGGGSQSASQGFFLTTTSGKIENGNIISDEFVQLNAGTLKLNNAIIEAGDLLTFDVTGSLFDAGGSSGNTVICNNGFNLAIKPPSGDLLGTALETSAPMFASVKHWWPGVDLGASNIGYTNNEAVGQLVLNEGFDSQFIFTNAPGASNAIYADLLDLSQCPDFLDPEVLTIVTNYVIYYAAAKLPSSFTIPPNTNGIAQEPEEFLNGQLGGHLVWVPSFAGPNSSVDVLINGKTVQVNKALRFSKIIDSNTNGIPNFYDANPFDVPFVAQGALVQNSPQPTAKFAISWTAAPGTAYLVQFSTNYTPAIWSPLLSYTNTGSTSVIATVWDTNAPSGQRFYRVSHP
jgi:hypothetical protein